jgi:hypothetical protein
MKMLTCILVIPALIASVALPVLAAPTVRSNQASVKRNSSIAMQNRRMIMQNRRMVMQNRRMIRSHHPMMHHSMMHHSMGMMHTDMKKK